MLRPARHRPRALGLDLLRQRIRRGACVRALGQRRQRHVPIGQLGRGNELTLAAVPLGQHLGRGRTAEDAWVDEAGEFDVGQVAGGAVDAFKVPDCFCAIMKKIKNLSISPGKEGGKSGPGFNRSSPTLKDTARLRNHHHSPWERRR